MINQYTKYDSRNESFTNDRATFEQIRSRTIQINVHQLAIAPNYGFEIMNEMFHTILKKNRERTIEPLSKRFVRER